jgi:hypothetical protein
MSGLSFTTSADLTPLTDLLGQERAREAIRFGAGIGQRGFNIFAAGSSAQQIHESVRDMLVPAARDRVPSADWIYVNNFATCIVRSRSTFTTDDDEAATRMRAALFDRYTVNLFISQPEGCADSPVIEELHPMLSSIVGRIEYLSQQGALVTNFVLTEREVAITSPSPGRWPGGVRPAASQASTVWFRNVRCGASGQPT